MSYANGDHPAPANWKEDARLAWKFVGVMSTITSIALVIAGWGFKAWADNLNDWSVRTEKALHEGNIRLEVAINANRMLMKEHIEFSTNKVMEYERRLTTLEVNMYNNHPKEKGDD